MAALPEGATNAHGRFSLAPAPPEIIAELERLLKAATGHPGTSDINAESETASATISADLWRQLKPGSLVLAAGFDTSDNLIGWWEAVIVRVDVDEFLRVGAMNPMSRETAAAANILPFFTCWFDQHHGVEDPRPNSVKPHPEEPVAGEEPNLTRALELPDGHLMLRDDELKLQ